MYRILIADDESIVIESLKFIIESKFKDSCEIQCAKSGRSVIEIAETFRPDIAFMDIHMPGINGIDAMKEIRKNNQSIIFIVMTAYDKFDYAREAIKIGVLEYLSKPVNREKIEGALTKAMSIIDGRRELRSKDLTIKEKLENVIPFIERGLIYTLLMDDGTAEAIGKYKELLGISDEYGFIMVVEAKQEYEHNITNYVGSSVRLEDHYEFIKETIKDEMFCIVGPVMTNKIIIMAPADRISLGYDARTKLIEHLRGIVHRLEDDINIELKVGIGTVKRFGEMDDSYQEALSALRVGVGSVSHYSDVTISIGSDEDYPVETEKRLFAAVEKGDSELVRNDTLILWNWMTGFKSMQSDDIKIKVMDYVLWAERIALLKSNNVSAFSSRTGYLKEVAYCDDMQAVKKWFIDKMTDAAAKVSSVAKEMQRTPVEKAIVYINENYSEDISLEQMSQMLGISPYYFSKLFKSEEGTNFIDYLTTLRMTKAKEMLAEGTLSVKEIGARVGYPDPNYFSRSFKKNVGVSPTEYKGEE